MNGRAKRRESEALRLVGLIIGGNLAFRKYGDYYSLCLSISTLDSVNGYWRVSLGRL